MWSDVLLFRDCLDLSDKKRNIRKNIKNIWVYMEIREFKITDNFTTFVKFKFIITLYRSGRVFVLHKND